MTDELSDIERRLSEVVRTTVRPLQVTKVLVPSRVEDLMAIGRELGQAGSRASLIPRSLVGTSLFVFTTMLTAAEYAEEPEPILDAAWQWEALLREAYGPDL